MTSELFFSFPSPAPDDAPWEAGPGAHTQALGVPLPHRTERTGDKSDFEGQETSVTTPRALPRAALFTEKCLRTDA